jgi:acetylornithine deacetylase
MKGFLALMLAAAPAMAAAPLARPVVLAFSYDEEIGCLGAPHLISALLTHFPRPALVVVGEPTDMNTVSGHKGIAVKRVTVRGREAHSSLTQQGVSAVMEAVRLAAILTTLAADLEANADPHSPFSPPYPTLTIGTFFGGTAGNILARDCSFVFDLRCPPGHNAEEILAPFYTAAAKMDAALKARFADTGVTVAHIAEAPPLAADAGSAANSFVRRLTGDNGPVRAVSYAAEAGQFQAAGLATVVCGPGSIEQAHQADEYLETAQLGRGVDFMMRLVEVSGEG